MHGPRTIAIAGVTGFIGTALAESLAARGDEVIGISRSGAGNNPSVARWQRVDSIDFAGCDAVVNLAGEPVDQRWSREVQKRLRTSRVDFTRNLVAQISSLPPEQRPGVLVNGSAIGLYGSRGDQEVDESAEAGSGFLADLCVDWETEAFRATDAGLRVAVVRTGIVLGQGGAAFAKLRKIFKLGIGGRLGDGRQWMSWIHLDDLRTALLFALDSDDFSGPFNGVAPHAVRNEEFTRELARALHRPAIIPVPGFALQIALGEFSESLRNGQHVLPRKLEAAGFEFRYRHLAQAFQDLCRHRK